MRLPSNNSTFHVQQHDRTDCGVACLLTILKYFGGHATLAQLRVWSGTSISGTTLLGIQEAAHKVGLEAEGFEAELHHVKELTDPAILHTVNAEGMDHFIVVLGYDKIKDQFECSDPAETAIKYISSSDLKEIWKSGALMVLKPGNAFQKSVLGADDFGPLKWLYNFAKPDINILFVSFILGVCISGLGLSVAVFTQKLVDQILPDKNIVKLLAGSGLLLFLLTLRSGLGYIRQLFLSRQSRDFNVRILSTFYSALLHLPKSFFDSRKTGELISRMNDTTRIQQTVANVFTHLTLEIVVVILSLAGLFYYQVMLGWIAFLWLPFFAWLVYHYQGTLIQHQRQVMMTAAINESNYIDTIQGVSTIKSSDKEDLFIQQTKTVYSFYQDRLFQLGLISNRFNTLAQILSGIFITLLILWGSWLVIHDLLSVGTVMAVIQLISMAMVSAAHIASITINLQEAKVALDRMQEFSTLSRDMDPLAESTKLDLDRFESLQLKNIRFRFTGRPLLLNDINLEASRGEIIVIQGESGGGKSTLLQILQRFYDPEEGEILVNNKTLADYSLSSWRKTYAIVPQQIKLFNGSLFENISLEPLSESNTSDMISFLERLGFWAYFNSFPHGYETRLGEDGVNISGGQQQLVGLARALYRRPQLLLLDEATAAMDQKMETWVLDLLQNLRKEMGIILVSHRGESLTIADRVYHI